MAEIFEKIALHPKSTVAVPPIYEGTYSEKVSLAFPGNAMGGTNRSFFLFVQQEEVYGSVDKFQGNLFWIFLAINPWEKLSSLGVETWWKPAVRHIA